MAVGDFNGDGKPDLVVANDSYAGVVSVLLGDGSGSFQNAGTHGAGPYPQAIATGDFNGDGKLDVVVANRWSGQVSVLVAESGGAFQASSEYGVGANPRSFVVGDFNGDGKLDIAMANEDCDDLGCGGNVTVLFGDGYGAFQTALIYITGNQLYRPRSVALGDFNADGKSDLAVATQGSVLVLLGNGSGAFPTVTTNSGGGVSIAVGDLNDDGKLDLVVANRNSGVSVLLGNGDGAFQPLLTYGTGPYPSGVAIGDFNGDGVPDLAVANAGSDNVSVLLGNGDGTFQSAVNFDAGKLPQCVAVGDFNLDGKLDLVAANLDRSVGGVISREVSVLLNTCNSAGIRLSTVRSNATVALCWPLPYTNFGLESAAWLGSTNWQAIPGVVNTNNGQCEISVPLTDTQRYFRLRKP